MMNATTTVRRRQRAPLTDAQRELATRYLPMARALARKTVPGTPGAREELESAAHLALVEAAQTFDPSVGVNFASYARHRIRGALRDVRRARLGVFGGGGRGRNGCVPVFQRLGPGSEIHGQVLGIHPESPVGTEVEAAEAVEKWLRRLPRHHATACRLIYIEGKSQDEAAAIVRRSKSTISRLHQEALDWLIGEMRSPRIGTTAGPASRSA